MVRFVFDLDGTVTAEETLPVIARHFGIEEDMRRLTAETVSGNIPFVESFIRRVHMMAGLPVDEVAGLLEGIPLHKGIRDFILAHRGQCAIATGNLHCWVDGLVSGSIGCACFASDALVEKNRVVKLRTILRKEAVVRRMQEEGDAVVFIGEGNNDLEAMRTADVSIASGLTHSPAGSVLGITDYVIYDEEAICRQLNQLS